MDGCCVCVVFRLCSSLTVPQARWKSRSLSRKRAQVIEKGEVGNKPHYDTENHRCSSNLYILIGIGGFALFRMNKAKTDL